MWCMSQLAKVGAAYNADARAAGMGAMVSPAYGAGPEYAACSLWVRSGPRPPSMARQWVLSLTPLA